MTEDLEDKFMVYLIIENGIIGIWYSNDVLICSPSECILMIPPIGWDCE